MRFKLSGKTANAWDVIGCSGYQGRALPIEAMDAARYVSNPRDKRLDMGSLVAVDTNPLVRPVNNDDQMQAESAASAIDSGDTTRPSACTWTRSVCCCGPPSGWA